MASVSSQLEDYTYGFLLRQVWYCCSKDAGSRMSRLVKTSARQHLYRHQLIYAFEMNSSTCMCLYMCRKMCGF
jgi:hypothetical protein